MKRILGAALAAVALLLPTGCGDDVKDPKKAPEGVNLQPRPNPPAPGGGAAPPAAKQTSGAPNAN